MGGAPHPFFKGKALGTRLGDLYLYLKKLIDSDIVKKMLSFPITQSSHVKEKIIDDICATLLTGSNKKVLLSVPYFKFQE